MSDLDLSVVFDQLERVDPAVRDTLARVRLRPQPFRVIEAGDSRVLIYRREDSEELGIAIKLFRGGTDALRQAEAEFRTLGRLQEELAGAPRLHVPRPIATVSSSGALVTEEVTGERVDRLLARACRIRPFRDGRATRTALTVCRQIGLWIVAFHRIQPSTMNWVRSDVDLNDVLTGRLELALDRVLGAEVVSAPEASDIRASFSGAFAALGEVDPVLHHPDLSPYNVIATRDGVYLFDLANIGVGHPFEEIAFFWAELESLKLAPWLSSSPIRRCQSAFLRAACGNGVLPEVWQRWGILLRLSYCATNSGSGDAWPRSLLKRLRRTGLRDQLRRLAGTDRGDGRGTGGVG